VEAAREQGLLVLTAGDTVVRLAPPLSTTADEIDEALAILGRILC
jgi:acetylornithine aminotransferase